MRYADDDAALLIAVAQQTIGRHSPSTHAGQVNYSMKCSPLKLAISRQYPQLCEFDSKTIACAHAGVHRSATSDLAS